MMAEASELDPLKSISSQVDESYLQNVQLTECFKAQFYLAHKYRKKVEQSKERCALICSGNLKQQSEITQAQQQISSFLIAHETVKNACVDLKKELMLAKEKKQRVLERIEKGIKKYDELWLASKTRFESLPFMQNLLKAKQEVQNIKQKIIELENEEKLVYQEIETKTENCREIDRKRIVVLAEFIAVERPKNIKLIKDKSAAITVIEEELNNIVQITNDKANDTKELKEGNACTSIMPKLQLDYFNIDMNETPEKIGNDDLFTRTPEKTYSVHSILVINTSKVNKKTEINTEEYISSFFYKPKYAANKNRNYAKMKLINILDDVKIDNNEALKYVADVNPNFLQPIDSISEDNHSNEDNIENLNIKDVPENEVIEDVDMTASGTENMILPPTQFLDMTPKSKESLSQKYSQEEHSKKKVKFDLSVEIETLEKPECDKPENNGETNPNETVNSQLNASDDGFDKLKDIIMKKRHLDLSPQFVYTKNIIAPLKFKKTEEVVTSKFFPQEQNQIDAEVEPEELDNNANDEEQALITNKVDIAEEHPTPIEIDKEPMELAVQGSVSMDGSLKDQASTSQNQKVTKLSEAEKPISGFMFSQNSQITTDFMDESANATGFEVEFSSLDESLLLLSKADLSLPNVETQEVSSQDVPNFLAGLRKPGFSFFGGKSSEPKQDSSAPTQNQGAAGFSFNFKSDEKKNRGGLFSMFQ